MKGLRSCRGFWDLCRNYGSVFECLYFEAPGSIPNEHDLFFETLLILLPPPSVMSKRHNAESPDYLYANSQMILCFSGVSHGQHSRRFSSSDWRWRSYALALTVILSVRVCLFLRYWAL